MSKNSTQTLASFKLQLAYTTQLADALNHGHVWIEGAIKENDYESVLTTALETAVDALEAGIEKLEAVKPVDPPIPTPFGPKPPQKSTKRHIQSNCGMLVPATPGVIVCPACGESLIGLESCWIER